MNETGPSDAPVRQCPACLSAKIRDRGPLAYIDGLLQLPTAGHLFHCRTCDLYFRYPFPADDQLRDVYRNARAGCWQFSGKRRDFELVREALLHYRASGSVLDVGCFRGDFLDGLPDAYTRYGIEPARDAAAMAASKGIEMVGRAIDIFPSDRMRFDVITLIDVLEHLVHPLAALQRLCSALTPGGLLIVATGNVDALPWRLMRNDYWYYVTEHVSFFSIRWFRRAAGHLGMTVIDRRRFSHFNGPALKKWRQLAQALVFWLFKNRDRLGVPLGPVFYRPPLNRVHRWDFAPRTDLWKDHMLVVMQSSRKTE